MSLREEIDELRGRVDQLEKLVGGPARRVWLRIQDIPKEVCVTDKDGDPLSAYAIEDGIAIGEAEWFNCCAPFTEILEEKR